MTETIEIIMDGRPVNLKFRRQTVRLRLEAIEYKWPMATDVEKKEYVAELAMYSFVIKKIGDNELTELLSKVERVVKCIEVAEGKDAIEE